MKMTRIEKCFVNRKKKSETNIKKLRRGVQVGFVQESDDRGIRRAAGRACVEGTPAHRDCKDKQP